ncbi:hypothetical protein [Kluyvera intermedia]|uniref:Uncharacterized protein n=2 Tax=Enterobacteriaceae TaxID=543 RepID=A0AA95K158_KLUIN|nr:hypothetical protein [Kluyvera intermedia]WGL56871.1 hypothetical protein QBD33_03420 [Kluyvera intermedia]
MQKQHISLLIFRANGAYVNCGIKWVTHSMLRAVNNMMLDMPAAIARKYYQDRLMRQIKRKKEKGKRKKTGKGWHTKKKYNLTRTLRKKTKNK